MRPAQPGEEALHRAEPSALGRHGDGLAVGFAVAVKPALVALQDRAGDFLRVNEIAFLRPAEERAQSPFVHVERLFRVVALVKVGEPCVDRAGECLGVTAVEAVGFYLRAATLAAGAHSDDVADAFFATHWSSLSATPE